MLGKATSVFSDGVELGMSTNGFRAGSMLRSHWPPQKGLSVSLCAVCLCVCESGVSVSFFINIFEREQKSGS